MTHVVFRQPNGEIRAEGEAAPGTCLLEFAQSLHLPLEGTCEGAMACSTCHVFLARADWSKLPPPGPHEEDMLDFAAHAGPTSRLACQIVLGAGIDTLDVTLPPSHADLTRF